MSTSALKQHTTAVLMLSATIPRDHSTVLVNLDMLEKEGNAKVNFCGVLEIIL